MLRWSSTNLIYVHLKKSEDNLCERRCVFPQYWTSQPNYLCHWKTTHRHASPPHLPKQLTTPVRRQEGKSPSLPMQPMSGWLTGVGGKEQRGSSLDWHTAKGPQWHMEPIKWPRWLGERGGQLSTAGQWRFMLCTKHEAPITSRHYFQAFATWSDRLTLTNGGRCLVNAFLLCFGVFSLCGWLYIGFIMCFT